MLTAGCGGGASARPEVGSHPGLFDKPHWERATGSFVKAYRKWVAREGLEDPAVRLERVLTMTRQGGYVVAAENAIISEMAVADIPVITGKRGEIPPEVVYDLRVEATEQVLRSGDVESHKTTIYFKLFEPGGRGIVVSEAHAEQLQRELD